MPAKTGVGFEIEVDGTRANREVDRFNATIDKTIGKAKALGIANRDVVKTWNDSSAANVNFTKSIKKTGIELSKVNGVVGGIATGVSGLSGAMHGASGEASALVGGAANLVAAFAVGGPLALGITAVATGVGVLTKKWKDSTKAAKEALEKHQKAIDKLLDGIDAARDAAAIEFIENRGGTKTKRSLLKIENELAAAKERQRKAQRALNNEGVGATFAKRRKERTADLQKESKAVDDLTAALGRARKSAGLTERLEARNRQDKAKPATPTRSKPAARASAGPIDPTAALLSDARNLEQGLADPNSRASARAYLEELQGQLEAIKDSGRNAEQVLNDVAKVFSDEDAAKAKRTAEILKDNIATANELRKAVNDVVSGIAGGDSEDSLDIAKAYGDIEKVLEFASRNDIDIAQSTADAKYEIQAESVRRRIILEEDAAAKQRAIMSEFVGFGQAVGQAALTESVGTLNTFFTSVAAGEKNAHEVAAKSFLETTGRQLVGLGTQALFKGTGYAIESAGVDPRGFGLIGLGTAAIAAGVGMGAAGASFAPQATASSTTGTTTATQNEPTQQVVQNYYGIVSPHPEDSARQIATVSGTGDRSGQTRRRRRR